MYEQAPSNSLKILTERQYTQRKTLEYFSISKTSEKKNLMGLLTTFLYFIESYLKISFLGDANIKK